MPKKFHFSSLFSYCEQTLFRGEMQLNVLLLVVVENMYSAPSVRLMADSCVYVCVGVMYNMLDALVHKRSQEGGFFTV